MGSDDAGISVRRVPAGGTSLSSGEQALGIVTFIVGATIVFSLWHVRTRHMSPEQYILGGRSFGTFFLWLLLAGEVYTSFTFLGAAGWAYGRGAPAYYILCYGTIAYAISYFLLPPIWRVAKARNLLTLPDFFVERYGSRPLGAAIGLLHFFLIVPYVTLQLTGLQILLTIAGYGHVAAESAVFVAFAAIALFVFCAGLRGTAWASAIKDALVLGAVIFVGIFVPIHFFGSPAAMFDRLIASRPDWLVLHGSGPYPPAWFVSTVLLTGAGFYMSPHAMAAVYSARDERTLRRNAIFLPFYQLILLLVFFAGFTALLVVPGLKGTAADQSFMLLLRHHYAPWVVGVIAGAGCLAALVPATAQLLGAASVVSKNVLGDIFGIATADRARTAATRILVIAIALMAVVFWKYGRQTLVELLLLYYNGITQMLPGFVFGLSPLRIRALAIGAGIAMGIAAALFFQINGLAAWHEINVGLVALGANVATLLIFSVATKEKARSGERAPSIRIRV